ncbi:probable transmembrane ascorbate ferrireductase 3 [Diospyros lotus]|uniref:probable transmembrane ascorbate ferrireductase 3 n=1 Tax=Diospyros lotus TaxID=55363 RepID=UPI0022577228|nr:probable transmembrane ascorbate ferrireductase 3 [Diospyros lotus]
MDSFHRVGHRTAASSVTVLAQLFGITALILLLIWLLHFREGLNLDSENPYQIFNVHPFLMYFGFIFFGAQAMMAFKTVAAERDIKKFSHMFLHVIAITLGIVGIYSVFKFHDKQNIKNMYSLHSWIGMGTFCLYGLQWLFGFTLFMFPKATEGTRRRAMPWHISYGRALLYMSVCAALTGLMEKVGFLKLQDNNESRLINFTGLAILLFGITVDLSITLARYLY